MKIHSKNIITLSAFTSALALSTLGATPTPSQADSNSTPTTEVQTLSSTPALPASTPFLDPQIFVKLAKKMVPSVVNISTLTAIKGDTLQAGPEDLFQWFFGDMPTYPRQGQSRPKAMALGTGFIIDSSGLILTNNHVVQDADEIKISLTEAPDEKPLDGEVVGRDPETDIALIRVKTKKELIPVALGDSDKLEVGEFVMAVGNPFGHGHSVTHGIISAKSRPAPDFLLASYLQTDAPINPGNSGGPLVDMKGEVIAINNAIDQRAHGIGFAIPINIVKAILPQLRTKGTVARGYIGIAVKPITAELAPHLGLKKDAQGVLVAHVYPNEPADQAKLRAYDLITEFNGNPVKTEAELLTHVTSVEVGQSVPVKVERGGKTITVNVKVGQRPSAGVLEAPKPQPLRPKTRKSSIETGMNVQEVTPEVALEMGLPKNTKGIFVDSVAFGSPAHKAGITRGDVLLEMDKRPLHGVNEFYTNVNKRKNYLLRGKRVDPEGNDSFHLFLLDLNS